MNQELPDLAQQNEVDQNIVNQMRSFSTSGEGANLHYRRIYPEDKNKGIVNYPKDSWGSIRRFKFNDNWYQVGDHVEIGTWPFKRTWTIRTIGTDSSAVFIRYTLLLGFEIQKTMTGAVEIEWLY